MAMGLEEIQGSDSLWSKPYADYLQSVEPDAPKWDWKNYLSPALDDLNVKYILTPSDLYLDPPPGKVVYEGDMRIYQRSHPRPRASLDDGTPLAVVRRNPNRLGCSIPAPETTERDNRTRLLWRDPFYPGWRAFVDGKPSPIEKHRGIFKAVEFGRDSRQVEFVFFPTSVRFGLFLALLSMGVGLGCIVAKPRPLSCARHG
jgi:hypothetical protein